MAETSNGLARETPAASLSPVIESPQRVPDEMTNFTVGGNIVRVRPLFLFDLRFCKPWIDELNPETTNWDYAANVLRVLSYLQSPEDTPRDVIEARAVQMERRMRHEECAQMVTDFNQLLVNSGFQMPEPNAPVENPGTGMSTDSSQNSQSGEFVEAIQGELDER